MYRPLLLAAYGLATAHDLLCIVNGDDSVVFCFFLILMTLTSELGRDFCTMYLTAKFDRPTVIVRKNKQTNKQTPLKTSTSLRYAALVGKNTKRKLKSKGMRNCLGHLKSCKLQHQNNNQNVGQCPT